jgi:glycosyltransferase involved in cell wall biosynthesis
VPVRGRLLDILYVGELPPYPGGTAIVAGQLLAGLATRGHSVRALGPSTAAVLAASDRFAAGHPEIVVTRFTVPYFDLTGSHIRPAADCWAAESDGIASGMEALVAEARPDVVIVGRERFLWYVPDLARARGLTCLLLVQSVTSRRILDGAVEPATAADLLTQYHKVDGMVLVARHLAEPLERFGFRDLTIIPNGVDLRTFAPRPRDPALLRRLDLRPDQIVVVHASNLKDVKRPLDVVDAAEPVLRRHPEAVYVVVGDGPNRRAMEARCRQKGILGSFRFVGWVEHGAMPSYLNLADVVIMPSEHEALALIYLEAQACGRVLLASDIPAAREVIEDGQTGLLFRMGDVDDLAVQTLRAVGGARLRAAIGRRARESVRTLGVERMVAAYEEALWEVASRGTMATRTV